VYTRWSRWARQGVWAAILYLLSENADGVLGHLDATHVKVHEGDSNRKQDRKQDRKRTQ